MGFDIPSHAESRMLRAYERTPHFRNRAIEWLPLLMAVLPFIVQCFGGGGASEKAKSRQKDKVTRKIKRGGRYAQNVAIDFVRDEHPDMPQDQQEVLADNLVEEWSEAPEHEIREMLDLSEQVVVN